MLQDALKAWGAAARALAAHPGFTLVALLTLLIGIASSTAIFTLVNAILLRPLPSTMFLVVRSSADPAGTLQAVRTVLRKLDPGAALTRVASMDELLVQRVGGSRLVALLMAGFAVLAAVLAAVGLYGAVSQWVERRRQEIGVRMTLGATGRAVTAQVLRQGVKLAAIGAVVGLAAAAALTRVMSAMLYGVAPRDPLIFAAVPLVLVVLAAAACLVPARRAAALDPLEALRSE